MKFGFLFCFPSENSLGRTRTCDPRVNSSMLYQLSYGGIFFLFHFLHYYYNKNFLINQFLLYYVKYKHLKRFPVIFIIYILHIYYNINFLKNQFFNFEKIFFFLISIFILYQKIYKKSKRAGPRSFNYLNW